MRQREILHGLFHVEDFGALRFQEFLAGRHVGKELAHLHHRTAAAAGRSPVTQHAVTHFNPRAQGLALRPGQNEQPGHRGDTRNGLAAKAQTANAREFRGLVQFGGGVPLQTEERVIPVHARAVIAHPHQSHAAALNFHQNAAGLGVQAVFHQLFHHRCRPVHHLARSDLIRYLFRKQAYA